MDGWGIDDPRSLVVEHPLPLSGFCVQCVELGIATAKIDEAIGYQCGCLNSHLVVYRRIVAGLELPFLFSGGSINGIEEGVPTADIDIAVRDSGRSMNDIAGPELPF